MYSFAILFRSRIAAAAFTWALALVPAGIGAQAADTEPAGKPAAEKPAPVAIPLSEVSAQADAASVNLRSITAGAASDEALAVIQKDLPTVTRDIEARLRENARIVAQRPSPDLLRSLEQSWQKLHDTLSTWSEDLEERLAGLDRDLTRVNELEKTWKETNAAAAKDQAPPELLRRAEGVLAAIPRARTALEAQRAVALRLQDRVAAQDSRVGEALQTIAQARDAMLSRIFHRDSLPLWSRALLARAGDRIAVDSEESRELQSTTLGAYAERHSDRFLIHAALFAVLAALLYWIRRRVAAWSRSEPALQRTAEVFAWPIATALVLALIGSQWLYPQGPRALWALIGAAALIPTVLILRRIAAPYLLPLLYAVVGFYFVDQIRTVTASIELVPRLIFVAEMIGGAGFLLWFLRTVSRNAAFGDPPSRTRAIVRFGALAGCAFFAVTAIANALGYVGLSNLLGAAALRSMYFGLVLYAVVQILDALAIMALRLPPLNLLGMVRGHSELLRRRTRAVLHALAFVWWLLFALDRLAIRSQVVGGVRDALTAEFTAGAISISLGDVLAFVAAVWASFIVSRFVRFVLAEEVYPHARLKRGLPYAISQTLHYLILVAGFFVAMAAVGVDMTKFTILAGAFTVGVGFGLQNIFNNFVSGLILLFERPVQVGDMIQMDDAAGIVERIGIRASIVRTSSGSEVIVPNGKLISERLVNWTFSDRRRGFEVPVSVVLGSEATHVISTLERAAKAHSMVLKSPAPQALLVRMGPDYLGFELRAYTGQVEEWMKVRSDLAVAITAAFAAEKIALR